MWVSPKAGSQGNERTCFGTGSLSSPPSQFVPPVLPATPRSQNFNTPLPRRPGHSFAPVDDNRKTHLQTCLGTFRKGWPSLLRPLWMKEVQRTHPCDPSIKKKKICAGSVQPEVSRICHVASATLPSLVALMIEHRRRFGLFNLKPLCLSLSSRKPVTLGRAW